MSRTRRRFLVGLVGAAGGLAGCAGDSGGGDATTTTEEMTTTTTTTSDTMDTTDGTTTTAETTTATTTTTAASGPAWLTAELTDVTTDETFTVAGLAAERPVLLETFAVWCPVCTRQQYAVQQFKQAHPDVSFSVSLNTDPNESAEKVRSHATENGFDWRYAIAPPRVSTSLQSSFGATMLNPPSAPMAVVCSADADAATRLKDGVKGTDTLLSAVEGC